MFGVTVNPASVKAGDKIATKTRVNRNEDLEIVRSRTVQRVSLCPGKPECIHLDHECYDTRFSTVVVPA